MSPAFFEGPEKKLELTVVDGFPSLRSLPDRVWRDVVGAAGAHILSRCSNEHFDAYLLSESSLFVYHTFVTIITCGQTRMVEAVRALLEHVPVKDVAVLIYERKNEHFPHEQATSFYEDAKALNAIIPGRALCFGAEHEHAVRVFHTQHDYRPDEDDATLEVLMHGIDESCAQAFREAKTPTHGTLAAQLGLDTLLPGFELDEHLFDPAGYSLNGMRDGQYFTIHVTPQRMGSYVSFETNCDFRDDASALVGRITERFKPESFDVLSFVPRAGGVSVQLPDYLLRRHVEEELCGYRVTFQHFYRPAIRRARARRLELP